jgi:hypothetical protein
MGVIPKKALVIDLNHRWPRHLASKHDFLDFDETYDGLLKVLGEIAREKNTKYDWLVLDTLTDANVMLQNYSIQADFGGLAEKFHSYNAGLKHTPGYMTKLLAALDQVGQSTGMHLGIIAHAANRDVKNPLGKDYAKVCLDLPEKVGAVVMQWADYVGYAHYNVAVLTEGLNKRKAGQQQRVIAFADNPAHEGKNGSPYKLPSLIAFDEQGDWSKIAFGETTSLVVEAEELLAKLPEEHRKLVENLDFASMDVPTLKDFIAQGKQYITTKKEKK